MTPPAVMHVVLARWKQGADLAELEELTVLARNLSEAIPGILAVHVGPSSSPEGLEGGFEWALVVGFATAGARDDYLPHPAHRPVAELISGLAERVVVFDVDA